MKFSHISLLLISIFTIGCKTDQKPPSVEQGIYSNYYIRYLEPEGKLRAEATFRKGDSLQNALATQFREVTCNGNGMVFKDLSAENQRYLLNISTDFPNGGFHFGFTNDAGTKEIQSFLFAPTKNLSVQGAINKSKGAAISWEGDPLNAEESIVCLFSNEANKTTSLIIKGPSQGSKIDIPPKKMKGLTPGKGQLYLVRKKRARNQSETRVSFAQMEYYSKTIDVTIE